MEAVNKKVIAISLVMALISTFLVYLYIKKVTSTSSEDNYVTVYIASKTMPARYKILDTDIKQVKIGRRYLNSKAILNKTDIIGKRLKDKIIEGEQILLDRLVNDSDMHLSYNVSPGKRAISVNINEQIGVGNLVRPEDLVDVIASFDSYSKEDKFNKVNYPKISKIIIQKAKVLSVGKDQYIDVESLKEPPKTITLEVSPEDAEKLVYISDYAIIRLALRNVDDKNNITTDGVIRNDLIGEKGLEILPK